MHCNIVKLVLFASQLGSHIPQYVELNNWILSWLTCKDTLGSQLFCTLLWKLWFARTRNQAVFKGVAVDPVNIASSALLFVQNFNSVNPRRNQPVSSPVSGSEGSRAESLFSMFVDAGCFATGQNLPSVTIASDAASVVSCIAKKSTLAAIDPVIQGTRFYWLPSQKLL